MMDWDRLQREATDFFVGHPENYVTAEDAIREDLVGLRLYDAPLFAVGAADDPLFARLQDPQVVHPGYRLPAEWVPGAKSVVAFFVPFTERIRQANAEDFRMPAPEWLHGRYEGEALLVKLRMYLRDRLIEAGYAATAPMHDERFAMLADYAPNWSERHTGYVCGLGTFGMSKGLITARGVAGRLGSVVTSCELPVTQRAYDDVYAYCVRCGQCATHCPVRCIDPARGMHKAKAHPPCDKFLAHVRSQPPLGKSARTRYGCGKCQVAVPCEREIPGRNC